MAVKVLIKSVVRLLFISFAPFCVLGLSGCGQGGSSSNSTTCAATGIPGAPTNVSASAGSLPMPLNASALVYFSAPISGGTEVSSYIVTSDPGSIKATGTGISNQIMVYGLTNGTAYTFTVQAVNCKGTSVASMVSNSVTPGSVPDAPTDVSATPGNGQAVVGFTPPTNNGGASLGAYTVTSHPDGVVATGTASPIVVVGLNNGTPYTFTVQASNIYGAGAASNPSNAVTPTVIPTGAPTGVIAVAGDAQASVQFTPPNTGGATATGYTVTSSPGGITASGAASPIVITGLTNNTAYTFTVSANYLGSSSVTSLPSNSIIPTSNLGPYFVDPATGSNTGSGTSGSPFKTITYALAVAAGVGTANTINAAAGTYSTTSGETFPLRMVNNVNLAGAGAAVTVIDGAGYYAFPYITPAITPLAVPPNVTSTVSDFTITGGWQSSGFITVMTVIDAATSATLNNNVIIAPSTVAADGLWVVSGATATLTGNTISGNGYHSGYGGLAILSTGYGIPKVTARSNTISSTGDPAIKIYGYTDTLSPTVDLGTTVSPGNNIINGPATNVGLYIIGVATWVNASGNKWHANIQGASADGSYAVGTTGVNPTSSALGDNYSLTSQSAGLQF